MRVAIIGSRHCPNLTVEEIISHIPLNCSQIITGGAEGVDALAAEAARQLKTDLVEIKPDYKKYGKSAPLKRSEEIIQRAYLVLFFWDLHSKGTAYALNHCMEQHIPFKLIVLKQIEESLCK